jgi:hypothetical protein
MNRLPVTIPKTPALKPAEDYYRLRREGIGFIEQMGSHWWTDYNTHDPGITILEALCYAITDLAYRTGWDIKDLLAPATPAPDQTQPFPQQAFFTAREILTVNPTTPDDFRRLLIDLDGVRNAWVIGKDCGCESSYYAVCDDDGQLQLSFPKPVGKEIEPIKLRGLYEALLELEADPELGDLNDRKIVQTFTVEIAGELHPYTLELRFPAWELLDQTTYETFLNSNLSDIVCEKFLLVKSAPTDNPPQQKITDDEWQRSWRKVFYLTFAANSGSIRLSNVALRLIAAPETARHLKVTDVIKKLEETGTRGFLPQYRRKRRSTAKQIKDAHATLHSHRNLDEDYCRIKVVDIEEVAVCADIEVAPDADIERVQARIWWEIEQYFNPPVRFYTWQELLDEQVPVEEIFNGPELSNGFLKADELAAAGLKTVLRTSDIINRLMDIEGVIAVNHLLLTKYDAEGNVVKGAADAVANKSSAEWALTISALHQPRFYQNLSRFLFYKNGLPFLPRMDEAQSTLVQLHGEAERPKNPHAPQDLPIPAGTFRHPEDYAPVQYSFPLTYGIGPDGLPSHVGTERRAQARQLKAYLLVFEQLLANALAQVAHAAELFSLDPGIKRTYFVQEFQEALIRGYNELLIDDPGDPTKKLLNRTKQEALVETPLEFHKRRNRFLDHLMARFGEQFGEYALLLTNYLGQQVAQNRLIEDKISFLNAYPQISHDRGKAFDYRTNPCAPDNIPGLKKRISLLLGYPDLAFAWTVVEAPPGTFTVTQYELKDRHGTQWLKGNLNVAAATQAAVQQTAFRTLIVLMVQPEAYQVVPQGAEFRLRLRDSNGNVLGESPGTFKTEPEAKALAQELQAWSANERAIVVEHLLLRPKFPGDALFPACADGPCASCGDNDPYSFRLTFVMPGWTEPYNINLELRGFADRTIQQEMPAHLLGKICWVGNDGFIENLCDPVVCDLAELLIAQGLTASGEPPTADDACACAKSIYAVFHDAFEKWFADKTLSYFKPEALRTVLDTELQARVTPAALACTTVLEPLWPDVHALLLKHFLYVAQHGWQFERFELAWCQWLEANAQFDWAEERLAERVEAILKKNLVQAPATTTSNELCQCAATILATFGQQFYLWMEANLQAGRTFPHFTPFAPAPLTLCDGFTFATGTAKEIEDMLKLRYQRYGEVSSRLWMVVQLLSQLRNTYPGATLHDCDDGSDLNPVRLGQTALGNYPLRKMAPTTAAADTTPALMVSDAAETKRAVKARKPGKARKPKPPA